MKALVFNEINRPLDWQEMPEPRAKKKSDAVVELRAAALNHRDVFIAEGLYPGLRTGTILGSDGAGFLDGKRVVVCPSVAWGRSEKAPAPDFRVLGMPDDGTFAEAILMPRRLIFPMPAHLDFESAAALPLAGLTAFRAVFSKIQLKKGEKCLITGIGGGVALAALQFARAVGAEVFVTSSSDEKIERAVQLGASGGANYRDDGWEKKLKKEAGAFDAVVDSAGGEGFAKLVGLMAPAGRLATFGGTRGKIDGLSPQLIFWRQLSIFGTSMGSEKEFAAMLRLVEKHEIRPVISEIFELKNGPKAMEKMARGEQFGKLVFKI